jgi:hypothetical protein
MPVLADAEVFMRVEGSGYLRYPFELKNEKRVERVQQEALQLQ